MALILLLESSTEVCSVALANNGKLVSLKENQEGLNHSELLGVFVRDILEENAISAEKLDAIAVSKGPGSYTGLRIGVSLAKGICYAAQKPLMAISTLDAMADYVSKNPSEFEIELDTNSLLSPMIDARRMEVYTCLYGHDGQPLEPISAKIIEEGYFSDINKEKQILFFGNGAFKCKEIIKHPNAVFKGPDKVSARFMISLAEEYVNKNAFVDVAYFEPYYLKDFVATVPKNKVIK